MLFFVDGLDEYEGSHHKRNELNDLMKTLAEFSHVKVCTSSRPWPVFDDAFKSCPKLLLDDLTRPDVIKYVHDRFYESTAYQVFEKVDSEGASSLVHDVVKKAEGIFLWVSLVTEELLQALQAGHSLFDLNKRLHSIPPDLNTYFRRILGGIETEYKAQASTLFLAILHSNTSFLSTVSFIEEERVNFEAWPRTSDDTVLRAKEELLIRMVETRCKGFLQTRPHDACGKLRCHRITFLHRTARDFLSGTEIHAELRGHAFSSFRPEDFALDALTVQLRIAITLNSHDLIDVMTDYLEQLRTKKQIITTLDLRRRIKTLHHILDSDCCDHKLDSGCHVSHSLRTVATLSSWQTPAKSLEPLLQLYDLGSTQTAGTSGSHEDGTGPKSWPLTCPYAVHAKLACWSGRGPCLCYRLHPMNDEFGDCFVWHGYKTAYLKEHLIKRHRFSKSECERCLKDFGWPARLHIHQLENLTCQIKKRNDCWKMSSDDEKVLELRVSFPAAVHRTEYWLKVYKHLFPESPLPLSPHDTHLWRHKPGTGGTEYVREYSVFKDDISHQLRALHNDSDNHIEEGTILSEDLEPGQYSMGHPTVTAQEEMGYPYSSIQNSMPPMSPSVLGYPYQVPQSNEHGYTFPMSLKMIDYSLPMQPGSKP